MDRQKAKQLLELCRPGNQEDLQDPALAQAFALLETDAELKAWFDDQHRVDERISRQLRNIEAPADLKDTILAGHYLHTANKTGDESAESSDDMVSFPQRKHTRLRWLSALAGVAALFLVVFSRFILPGETSAPTSINAGIPPVIQFLSKEIDALSPSKFDLRDPSVERLKDYLASTQSPTPQSLPAMLQQVPTVGCLTLQFEGAPLSVICFKNGVAYHLVTAEKRSFPGEPPNTPELFELQGKTFRLWTEGEQIKILTIHGPKKDFPEFI